MSIKFSQQISVFVVLLITLLSGCGGSGIATYPVTGRVVFPDGTPVTFGSVEFHHPHHDLTSRGSINPDGSFHLGTFEQQDGAPAGLHHVVLIQLIMTGETGITPSKHGRHIDSRYSSYDTSDLELEVVATHENDFRIVVQVQPKR